MSDTSYSAQYYKDLHRRVTEDLWNNGNLDAASEHLHPELKAHQQAEGFGPDDLVRLVSEFREAFPDLEVTIERQIVEGDQLASYTTFRGTHRGVLRGFQPTGQSVTMKGMCITDFVDGKVVNETVLYDQADILRQLGGPGTFNVFARG